MSSHSEPKKRHTKYVWNKFLHLKIWNSILAIREFDHSPTTVAKNADIPRRTLCRYLEDSIHVKSSPFYYKTKCDLLAKLRGIKQTIKRFKLQRKEKKYKRKLSGRKNEPTVPMLPDEEEKNLPPPPDTQFPVYTTLEALGTKSEEYKAVFMALDRNNPVPVSWKYPFFSFLIRTNIIGFNGMPSKTLLKELNEMSRCSSPQFLYTNHDGKVCTDLDELDPWQLMNYNSSVYDIQNGHPYQYDHIQSEIIAQSFLLDPTVYEEEAMNHT